MTESKEFDAMPAVSLQDGDIVVAKDGDYHPLEIDGELPDTADFIEEVCDKYGRCLVLDLNGISMNKPQIGLIQELGKRGDIWVDTGICYGESIIDIFIAGASGVIMGTKTLHDFSELEAALDLSDAVIFSIDYNEHVISINKGMERKSPKDLAAKAKEVGCDTVAFVDLGQVGKYSGMKDNIIRDIVRLDLDLYVGGGVKERDLPRLRKMGATGAFLEITEII